MAQRIPQEVIEEVRHRTEYSRYYWAVCPVKKIR